MMGDLFDETDDALTEINDAPEDLFDETDDDLTEINDAPEQQNEFVQIEPVIDDPVDELWDPNLPNPVVFPLPGDKITFLDRDIQPPILINAQVTIMKKTVQQRWPDWYNILCEGSYTQTSVNLVTSRWRYITVDDVPQVDGNYTLLHDDQFIDDTISDQGSLFGESHIEYMSNNLSESLSNARHDAFRESLRDIINEDNGRAFRLVQRLNLEIPFTGRIVSNRVYTIPPILRLPLSSVSEADLYQEAPRAPSAWHRRWQRLKTFLARLSPFRKK